MTVGDRIEKSLPAVLILAASWMSGCAGSEADPGRTAYSRADFLSLKWLEGDWRGTGGRQAFYEGYELVNDSTIRIRYYADSTRAATSRTGSVFYSDGAIYHEADGASWVAVELDSAGIEFVPHMGAQNSFRWNRLSPETWEAVLRFEDGSAARYVLTRIRGDRSTPRRP